MVSLEGGKAEKQWIWRKEQKGQGVMAVFPCIHSILSFPFAKQSG